MSLQGVLVDFPVADVFQLIAQQRKTGVLEVERRGRTLEIHFIEGAVLRARPQETRPDGALAGFLLRTRRAVGARPRRGVAHAGGDPRTAVSCSRVRVACGCGRTRRDHAPVQRRDDLRVVPVGRRQLPVPLRRRARQRGRRGDRRGDGLARRAAHARRVGERPGRVAGSGFGHRTVHRRGGLPRPPLRRGVFERRALPSNWKKCSRSSMPSHGAARRRPVALRHVPGNARSRGPAAGRSRADRRAQPRGARARDLSAPRAPADTRRLPGVCWPPARCWPRGSSSSRNRGSAVFRSRRGRCTRRAPRRRPTACDWPWKRIAGPGANTPEPSSSSR